MHTFFVMFFCIASCNSILQMSGFFNVRKSATVDNSDVILYRTVPAASETILDKIRTCIEDNLCLSFDASFQNVTKYFTRNVCATGTHCLKVRCPNLENMRYSRSMDLCYRVVKTSTDWPTANNTCWNDGGRLIVLDTEEKFTYVTQDFSQLTVTTWLGAFWTGVRWEWLNGKELLLSNPHWHRGEPNVIEHEYVSSGRRYHGHFGLDDENWYHNNYFICEY